MKRLDPKFSLGSWAFSFGPFESNPWSFSRFLDKIGHLHVIDSDGTLHNEETSTHSPFGAGRIEFADLFAALEPGIAGLEWWCVDFCFCPTTERDAVKRFPFSATSCDSSRSAGRARRHRRPADASVSLR